MTLLEEVADCVLPWLEQLDIVMAQKLGKFLFKIRITLDNQIIRLAGIGMKLESVAEVSKSVRKCYDIDLPPTATVRMLKAGLRLTQLIGSINEDMCDILLKAGLMKKLIFLLSIPVKSFASSLRIRNGII